jgi:hypothetical protein
MTTRNACHGLSVLVVSLALSNHVQAQPFEWRRLGLEGSTVLTVATHPSNPNILYAGTRHHGAFRSTDGGQNWSPINQGFSPLFDGSLWVNAIVLHMGNPSILFAAVPGRGIFRSTNAGASWSRVVASDAVKVTVDPANASAVYATSNGQGFARSLNGGTSWTTRLGDPRGPGFPSEEPFWDLGVDPVQNTRIFLLTSATGGRRLLESPDRGTTWHLSPAFPDNIRMFSLARAGAAIYLGTTAGVYARRGASWEFAGPLEHATTFAQGVGSRFYAGTATQGVFHCDVHCSSPSIGLVGLRVNELATFPGDRTRVYAATADGVYLGEQRSALPFEPGDQPPPGWEVQASRYLAEGATGDFWHTRLAVANPTLTEALARLRFLRTDASPVTRLLRVPAL